MSNKTINQISEALSSKLGISKDEVLSKLELTQESNHNDISKALGLYATFSDKESYSNTIEKKISNVVKEKNDLETKYKTDLEKAQDVSKKLLNAQWQDLKPSGELPMGKIDLDKIDFQNIKGELIKIGKENGLLNKPQPNPNLSQADNKSTVTSDGIKIHKNIAI